MERNRVFCDLTLPPWKAAPPGWVERPPHVADLSTAAGEEEPVRLDLTAGRLAATPDHVDGQGAELLAGGCRHDEPSGRRGAVGSPELEDLARQVQGPRRRLGLRVGRVGAFLRRRIERVRELSERADRAARWCCRAVAICRRAEDRGARPRGDHRTHRSGGSGGTHRSGGIDRTGARPRSHRMDRTDRSGGTHRNG